MVDFVSDPKKDAINQEKHGVSFADAQRAFDDPHYVIIDDAAHSDLEPRFFCFGKVDGEVMTVRFTLRGETVRLIGAAYWRKGKKIYEKENNL